MSVLNKEKTGIKSGHVFYIASPFFNPEQISVVEKIEEILDSNSISYFSPMRHGGILKNMTPEEKKKNAGKIFEDNVSGIDCANALIAVVDGNDAGTIFEMGLAFGMGKHIVAITNKDKPINVMLSHSADFHIYGMSQLENFINDWKKEKTFYLEDLHNKYNLLNENLT